MSADGYNYQESNAVWPICPSFLVKSVVRNERFFMNKHGVYSPDTVRGLLADASDDTDVQNPLSLFQVVPETIEFEKFPYIRTITPAENDFYLRNILTGKQVLRVDTNSLRKNRSCCDIFRTCHDCENKCHEQDCRISLLYHTDLEKYHYYNNFKEYSCKLNEIIAEYNKNIAEEDQLQYKSDQANKWLYVWYKCPYSGFLEYFFPIVHSGKVIAVLMQGQKIPKGLNKEQIFQNILNNPQVEQRKKDELQLSIRSISNNDLGKDPMSESCLNAIRQRIHILEKRIEEDVMSHASTYVSDTFHCIEKRFHEQIKKEIKDKKPLTEDAYKEIVNESLERICNVFNTGGFIRIYSTEAEFEEVKPNTDTFYLIGTSSELTIIERSRWGKIEFHNLPLNLQQLESMVNEDFYDYCPGLKKIMKFSNKTIFRIEGLSIGNIKHLVWKEYPNRENINQKQFDEFSNFLKTFYQTLWEPYNLLHSVQLRKDLEMSMRVSVHETSQIIPVIINTLQNEYSIDTTILIREDGLNRSGISQRTNTLYNTIRRLQLLDNLYKRSTLMFKELAPQKDWVDLHILIFSTKWLCREKAKLNNLQEIVIIDGFNFNQYKVYTDNQLISHALFNLVDNAIKYGYMGSRIYINISISEEDLQHEKNGDWNLIKTIQISIVSYGQVISQEEQSHLFDLFYRAPASKIKDGMGIGLFLVKKNCNSLRYTIEYRGSMLSECNLPIYYYGIQQKKTTSLRKISQTLIQEVVNQELSDKDWKIEDLEFDAAINQPTCRNEFVLTLNNIDNNIIKPTYV